MKKIISVAVVSLFIATTAFGAEQSTKDPNLLFYKANALYEKGDYSKAIETYIDILDLGIESGNLYYNAGNGFFKLGKIGFAILCYERAKRLVPGDSDLKSNLDYARSFVEYSVPQGRSKTFLVRIIDLPFRYLNMNALTILALLFYILLIVTAALFIVNQLLRRKIGFLLPVVLVASLYAMLAFCMRYYDEIYLKHGIVIQKEVECKYEPIDKSTTYYTIKEGDDVLILKTRNEWRQLKRLDGKIAWVEKNAVEEI